MKRINKFILETLENSYIDDFNRLEAYSQELRNSNSGTNVVIKISKDALAEGKKEICSNVCVISSFERWLKSRIEASNRFGCHISKGKLY